MFFYKFLTQQYENNLKQNLSCMDLQKVISKKNYDVISPSFDTLFVISVLFFVQIEIPFRSLQNMMGRFPSGEK